MHQQGRGVHPCAALVNNKEMDADWLRFVRAVAKAGMLRFSAMQGSNALTSSADEISALLGWAMGAVPCAACKCSASTSI